MPHRSPSGRTRAHIAVCAGVGGVLGLVGFYVTLRFTPNFLPLFAIWEAGMAFTLTIVAELPVDDACSVPSPPPPANRTVRLPSSS